MSKTYFFAPCWSNRHILLSCFVCFWHPFDKQIGSKPKCWRHLKQNLLQHVVFATCVAQESSPKSTCPFCLGGASPSFDIWPTAVWIVKNSRASLPVCCIYTAQFWCGLDVDVLQFIWLVRLIQFDRGRSKPVDPGPGGRESIAFHPI